MKKLINDPRHVVREMLEGYVAANPALAMMDEFHVVLRADLPQDPTRRPVALISGGGSGHEPAHAGYVGEGMLSAAVVGDVFTSPSVDAVLAAILATAGPAGAVLIVKNYTGDRLNFGLAAELALQQGIPTAIVVVADDVALRDTIARDRRRGIAGTVLVHKMAGAAAARGDPLDRVAEIGRSAASHVVTMGVGLGSCTVPAAGRAGFELGPDEIELGLGIHGEKGVARGRLPPVDELVDRMLEPLLSELAVSSRQPVALLVNGLGATTAMELAIVTRRALATLTERGVTVERVWTGNFMTALEMPGCSLSLLPLDEERQELLDHATTAPAWPGNGRTGPVKHVAAPQLTPTEADAAAEGPLSPTMRGVVSRIAAALDAAEPRLTALDSHAGDGDLGASMMRGAEALRALADGSYETPQRLLRDIGESLRRSIAGSSGPLYAAALLRASHILTGIERPTDAQWLDAFEGAIAALQDIGGARPGDRTMLDALVPASLAWRQNGWLAGASAAETAAAATASMRPRMGRAAYLGDRAMGQPDGGAVAVAIWLKAIEEALA
ncbi:dihydroxyacetone kinase family protein [Chelatococcus asaccharovorans]|uniref:dihydroxyacetone kinase family protein n=1 Tax=Chelatococcus asaccharovorans TaxID=28210 RepID=UPI00224C678B|nr:dihydroxyacetone kinase family protein [Chelatococcus asaccharovorans]CAH1649801.1 Dihydroxyacetone kinase, ATP-dependent [Chelatococcus asaccharovorans]CAH1691826.1 Dihydroxyacetone kinase, ATP-dependent [Chelatococcus asaccharovorans]